MIQLLSDFMAAVTSGNNSAPLTTSLERAGVLSRHTSALYIALFIAIGVLVEGEKVSGAFSSAFSITQGALEALLILSIVTMAALTLLRIPVSASQVIVSAAIGLTLVDAKLGNGYVSLVIVSWLTTFFAAFGAGYIAWIGAARVVRRRATPYFTLRFFLFLALASTALLSYALGANTISLFIAMGSSPLEVEVFAILGVVAVTFLMSRGMGRIAAMDPYLASVSFLSAALVVEIYTQMGVPVSIMQAVVGATLGAAWSARRRIYVGNIRKIAFFWLVVPPICLLVAFLIRAAFLTL